MAAAFHQRLALVSEGKLMWLTIREALLACLQAHPETIIHLAGGYARVKLSPLQAAKVRALS